MTNKNLRFHSSCCLCWCNNAFVNNCSVWHKSIFVRCIMYFNWRSVHVDILIKTSLSYVGLISSSILNDSSFFPYRSITGFVTIISNEWITFSLNRNDRNNLPVWVWSVGLVIAYWLKNWNWFGNDWWAGWWCG